jgi:transposase InsO family protein
METISGDARRELVRAVGDRYRASNREEKRRILDEFVAVTRWHRKHAIRVLNVAGAGGEPRRKPRARVYDDAIRQALLVLWEASDRICAKRLRPLLPALLAALERHGHLRVDERVRVRVLGASAATIDRLLAEPRAAARGRLPRRAGARPSIRRGVAVRTFADWKDPVPGSMEADLVAHCGNTVEGSFVHTLVLTDVATTWTECVPIVVREGTLIVEALDRLRETMPFPLRAFDTDNGSEFINETVVAFCAKHGIEFTRSRPYRKNDQAWVEQKNGAIVRRLVGYGRLEGIAAAETLARLYTASRLFVNFFQPSFKLAEKTREGSRVVKRYHTPATPCARLLASPAITAETKERLKAAQAALDPLRLLDEIRAVQHQLAALVAGTTVHVPPTSNADLEGFLIGLGTAWRTGEVRPTHAKKPRPRRHWRTRKDPLETVWPLIRSWLEAAPDRTAKELLGRLQSDQPGLFADGLLRTMQRRVHEWRVAAAKRLVFGPDSASAEGRATEISAIAAGLSGAISMRQAGSGSS